MAPSGRRRRGVARLSSQISIRSAADTCSTQPRRLLLRVESAGCSPCCSSTVRTVFAAAPEKDLHGKCGGRSAGLIDFSRVLAAEEAVLQARSQLAQSDGALA